MFSYDYSVGLGFGLVAWGIHEMHEAYMVAWHCIGTMLDVVGDVERRLVSCMRVYTVEASCYAMPLFNSNIDPGDPRLVLAAEDFLQPSHLLLVSLNLALALCELLH